MMIKGKILRRLLLPMCAAALLLLSLAYWWQSNLVHELAGTAMFVLVGRHIYMKRIWLLSLTRGRYDVRRWLSALLHLALIVNMLVLVATSVAVSQSLFAVVPLPENVTVRDLHWFGAYWLVMTVGIHLGLYWSRVMALMRSALGLNGTSHLRTWILRSMAMVLSALGIWSTGVMDLTVKLAWNRSLNFWDFNSSVLPFFAHWGSVLALPAILIYYVLKLLPRPSQTKASATRL